MNWTILLYIHIYMHILSIIIHSMYAHSICVCIVYIIQKYTVYNRPIKLILNICKLSFSLNVFFLILCRVWIWKRKTAWLETVNRLGERSGLEALLEDGDLSYYCKDICVHSMPWLPCVRLVKTLPDEKQQSGSEFVQLIFKLIRGR